MAEKEQYSEQALPEGCDLAIAAEAFYIVNMVLAPGLGFMMLAALYPYCKRKRPPAIAMNHLRQAISATVWAIVIVSIFAVLLWVTGGYPSAYFWPLVTIYFVFFHIPMSVIGVIGFGKALAGENYRYPVIGLPLLKDSDVAS
ncbi:MAG TPA: hypothetical protein EYH06_12885 [Chromatiales bacterium]|nr:hypothetical protein [Thiotrichales bacterium]HIP69460.1 hypothetical protein [Chromatiales bacterium]